MELGSQLGPQSQQIRPSIQTKSKKLERYSHPHIAPQWIPMGNCRLEHCRSCVNIAPPIVLKTAIVEPKNNMLK